MGLKEFRQGRGLSLDAISVLSGGEVDPATVSRIERGLVQPRPQTVVKLAKAFGIAATRMQAILAEGVLEEIARQ